MLAKNWEVKGWDPPLRGEGGGKNQGGGAKIGNTSQHVSKNQENLYELFLLRASQSGKVS